MIPRGFGNPDLPASASQRRWSLVDPVDDAGSYLGIATPNQRRIRLTAQSIASMLASFDMGEGVEQAKLDLVRMPGA
jgi:hypothetical protein